MCWRPHAAVSTAAACHVDLSCHVIHVLGESLSFFGNEWDGQGPESGTEKRELERSRLHPTVALLPMFEKGGKGFEPWTS